MTLRNRRVGRAARRSLALSLLAASLVASCKTRAAEPAGSSDASPARTTRSSPPPSARPLAVPSASTTNADAGTAECAREHFPQDFRARQATAKPVHAVTCRNVDCVSIEPVVETGVGCAEKCRPVTVTPRVAASDAARARAVQALLDAQLAEFRSDDCWLTFLDYTVHYDEHGLLDVSFRASGSGAYPSTQIAHVALELANPERLAASRAFSQRSLAGLAATMNRRVLAAWNTAAKQHPEVFQHRDRPEFRREQLENFVVHPEGVTFFFDFGLPHAVELAMPLSEFPFTKGEIRPFVDANGPLGFFAEPAP